MGIGFVRFRCITMSIDVVRRPMLEGLVSGTVRRPFIAVCAKRLTTLIYFEKILLRRNSYMSYTLMIASYLLKVKHAELVQCMV